MGSQKPRRVTSLALGMLIVFSTLVVLNFACINVRASGIEYPVPPWNGNQFVTSDDTFPHTGYDSAVINLTDGNLIICDGVTLTFNDNVTLIMRNNDAPGDYGIKINATAKFVIDSSLSSTTIKTDPAPALVNNTYSIHNSGTIDFLGATVKRVYGNVSDLDEMGGIVNLPGSVCELENCDIFDPITHGICVDNSNFTFKGANSQLCQWEETHTYGNGIWIQNNSNVLIEQITINNTHGCGIKCEDVNNVIIKNNMTIQNCEKQGVFCDNATIDIKNSSILSNGGSSYSGIYLYDSDDNTIEWSNINQNGYEGIYLYDSCKNVISNNIINNNTNGIQLTIACYNNSIYQNSISNHSSCSQTHGINCQTISLDGEYNKFHNNSITNNSVGFWMDMSSTSNTINDNYFGYNNISGIWLDEDVSKNEVYDNDIFYNGHGLDSEMSCGLFIGDRSKNNTVYNNNISNNNGTGIVIGHDDSTHNNLINNNIISFNQKGLFFDGGVKYTNITNNSFYNNSDLAIEIINDLGRTIEYTYIYHNIFINNNYGNHQVLDNSTNNSWDNGYPSGGNYWSDYAGTDQYCGENQTIIGPDFIGDTPYTNISGSSNSNDTYPLMYPWPCDTRSPRDIIRINNDTEFTSARGVSSGDGTSENPYVIENYVINATDLGCGIYVGNTTNHFEIRNCYIHNSSGYEASGYYEAAGININNATNGSIDKNVLLDNEGYGVVFNTANSSSITDCEIISNGEGIRVDWCSSNNSMEDNTISDNGLGCYIVENSNNNTFSGNNISSNDDEGIWIDGSCGNVISYNTLDSNGDYSIIIIQGDYNTIMNNTISSTDDGIHLNYSDDNDFIGNKIDDCSDYGIYCDQSDSNLFMENNLTDNNIGMNFTYSSDYNQIVHNDFFGSITEHAYDHSLSYNNWFDWGYPYGGNFWEGHDCEDNPDYMNPYEIPGAAYNYDYCPFMTPDYWL